MVTTNEGKVNGKPARFTRWLDRLMVVLVTSVVVLVVYLSLWPCLVERRVVVGMSATEVQALVDGAPMGDDSVRSLCRADGVQGTCEEARVAGAERLMAWRLGIDTFLLVGFDTNHRVVFRGIGDS